MNALQLAEKFYGRHGLEDVFNEAFNVLNAAIESLSNVDRSIIFEDGELWYSIEIITTFNPNVINYDQNAIVFHESPVFDMPAAGCAAQHVSHRVGFNAVQQVGYRIGFNELIKNVAVMQRGVDRGTINDHHWKLFGPTRFRTNVDKSVLKLTVRWIDELRVDAECEDHSTLFDYLRSMFTACIAHHAISQCRPYVLNAIIDRCCKVPNAPTVNEIKRMIKSSKVKIDVQSFVRDSEMLRIKYMEPFVAAFQSFGASLLNNTRSRFVADHVAAINLIRSNVKRTLKEIDVHPDGDVASVATVQMRRLKNVDNIKTDVEGIVFTYNNDRTYKLTGTFAPVNRILGLLRYGR
jgi:hypothetical protein